MAIFAAMREKSTRRVGVGGLRLGVTLIGLLVGQSAMAQTVGNGGDVTSAAALLAQFGFPPFITQPGNGMPVDFNGTGFGFIANPYIGVSLGLGGAYSINYGTNFTASYNTVGMISFGNLQGSTRIGGDNNTALNSRGFGIGDVFPVPGEFETATPIIYDYPAYLRARVDTTNVNIVAPGARFENSVLFGNADLGSNVTLRQEIRLYRTQAQLRWVIRNADPAVAHTVTLRFTVNQSGASFYEDPVRGLTNRSSIINGPDVPNTLAFYGARYEDTATGNVYATRHTFRGAGATPPARLVIGNAFEMRPRLAGFDVVPERQPGVEIATASYFGPFTLSPGQSAEVITYYGNATPSDRLDNDFVTSLDGPEALGYNALAANDPTIIGNTSQTITNEGVRYLTPNPFQIYAGIYNRVPSNPADKVDLTNVSASLTLPTGLAFATVPGTDTADTSRKVLGTSGSVLSDRGADTSWFVRPTGEAFGSLTYQASISTLELGGRQQTRSISIPAVPFRAVTATAFQMIGFPFQFDPVESNNGDPATVINTLTRPADEPVAFYRWIPDPNNPGDGSYQIVNQLQNGEGYMYRPQLSRFIVAKGVAPLARQAEPGVLDLTNLPQRQIILQPGWNMIANPYVYDLPFRLLRFAQPTESNVNGTPIPDVASQNLQSAINSGLVQAGIFSLNTTTNSYESLEPTTASARPWEAYWIYATNRVVLIYPVPTQRQSVVLPGDDVTPSPPTRDVTNKKTVKPVVITAPSTYDNWKLQLVAKRGESLDKALWIGASTKNEVESSRAVAKPPVPMANYVYLGIVKDAKATRYAKDVRNGRGAQTWNLEVKADADGPVTLTWPNVGQLSRRLNLKVKDVATGKVYALRSSSSLTVNVTKAQPTKLEVTSTTEASSPLLLSGVMSVRGGRGVGGGGREFSFRITRDATIRGTVTTLTGKAVAGLASGKSFTRGQGRIHWDGRAQDGSPLPPGPYLLELEARDADGNVSPISLMFMTTE